LPSIGILFDIQALGSALYGRSAYEILFEIIGGPLLSGCRLSDGDVNAQEYCIALQCEDAARLAEMRRLLAASTRLGLSASDRRLLTGEQVEQLPLVTAARFNSSGDLSDCETFWVRDAWERASRSGTLLGPSSPAGGPATASVRGGTLDETGTVERSVEAHQAARSVAAGPREYVPGQTIAGRYHVRAVRKGGMGIVYIVDDIPSLRSDHARVFALKTFQERFLWSEEVIQRFEAEAMSWTELTLHPHVVTALIVERIEGRPYLWLEYVDGESLAERLSRGGLDVATVLHLALQFTRGMRHVAERHGVVHRDIKPANCMLTRTGTLKIADFGLSRLRAELAQAEGHGPTEQANARIGTPAYMSPEVILDTARADTRTDIYAFGVMLHEMLTGRGLFRGPRILEQHLHAVPVAPSAVNARVPQDLDNIALKCLEKDPGRRFQTFAEVEAAFELVARRVLGTVPGLPDTPEISMEGRLFLRAFTLMEFGRYTDAVNEWQRLRVLTPKEAEVHNNLALCLAELGDLDGAMASARQAVALRPGYVQAWSNLGGFLGRVGAFDEGLSACDHAIACNSAWAEAHANRGANLAALDRFPEALRCFEEALRLDPRYWKAHVMSAECLAREGRPPDEVLAHVQRALEIHPRDAEALAVAAACLEDLARPDDADRQLALAESIFPDHPLVRRVGVTLRQKRADRGWR
jgi:tetratricopeptide (TPR) repeat protein